MTYFPPETLAPRRRPDESFDDYAARRRTMNNAVKDYLKGGIPFYRPVRIVKGPVAGVDPKVDEEVLKRNLRPVGKVTERGVDFRIMLTKGVSYVKKLITQQEKA